MTAEYRFDSVSSAKTTMRKKILDDWVTVHSFQVKRGKQNVMSPMRKDYLSKLSKKMFHQFVNILCLKFYLIIIIRHKTTSGFPFGGNFLRFQVS